MKFILVLFICFSSVYIKAQNFSQKHILWPGEDEKVNVLFENGEKFSISEIEKGKPVYSFVAKYSKKEKLVNIEGYPLEFDVYRNLEEKRIGTNWELGNVQKEISACEKKLKKYPNDTALLNLKQRAEDSLAIVQCRLIKFDQALITQKKVIDSISIKLNRTFVEKVFEDIIPFLEFSSDIINENKANELKYFNGTKWFYISREDLSESKKLLFDEYLLYLYSY
ncbi:MAG: hypothetical protein A2W91_10600 [Bacteroidetes bacterium GWF2_38_335]|nr:MAG: hypothetical protein A2W91_10600 [Bacteroidetes bacterium GWF2_38_335]OFY81847.1 MAG: hypothetical protein A2281_06440 [Bacteroidetes bacterium RIFOXYA12_FULL_38_20]HBS87923.1 hypothetical protein [Bacteroidales bacterium]